MHRPFTPSYLLALLTVCALAVMGVFYIYSTGYIGSAYPVRPNWLRQCVFLLGGGCVFTGLTLWDNQRLSWRFLVLGGYAASVVLLLIVLLWGHQVGGARRWIALGPHLLQPAEFARFFTILAGSLVLSGQLFRRRLTEFIAALGIFGVPVLLIGLEPSYGNAASLLPCMAVLLGARFLPKQLFALGALLVVTLLIGAGVGLQVLRNSEASEVASAEQKGGVFRGYHLRRFKSYLSAEGGWNERQSLMTVAGGGITGKGYLNGTMKNLGYLPRTVAPTDFIFAVIAEEGGLLFGVLPVMGLYLLLIAVILHWGSHAATRLDMNLQLAGATLLAIHVVVAVGMSIRLVPIIGLPLPLLSYGGSFTMAICALLGVVSGARHEKQSNDATAAPSAEQHKLQLGHLFRLTVRSVDTNSTVK